MIRKKVLSIGNNSATLLVQDTEANGTLCVLRRISVAGWTEDDVKMTEEAYETLRHARLRGFVPIHTVLVHNSFVSVVSSYAPEGDLATYVEEEVDSALEEQTVLRWLCACALSIREMQSHKLYFPGLTADRVFLDHQTGGTAQILLGVPLPLPVYITQMQERRRNGIKMSLDYPPEVLAEPNWSFHGTATDVWSLGRLGEVLLTAKGTGLARRSGSTRQLLARMMATEAVKRPSMESVAQSLIAMAGNVKLGQPLWPAKTASAASPPPPAHHPPTTHTNNAAAAQPSPSGASVTSQPPSSSTSSPPPAVPATRAPDGRKMSDAVRGPPSPPPLQEQQLHRDPAPRPAYAPDDSWHQRAQQQFEQLQRLNASPQKLRADGPVSPRGGQRAERRRSPAEAKSPSPRRGTRPSGVVDHNTRMLNEMFAEQETAQLRDSGGDFTLRRNGQHIVEDVQALQADAMRQLKQETAQRQQEMRKHFTEWQRQNNQRYTDAGNALVMEQDGVVIVAPRPAPPPGSPPPPLRSAPPTATASSSSDKAEETHTATTTTNTSDDGRNEALHLPLPTVLTSVSRNVAARANKPRQRTPPAASPTHRVLSKPAQPPPSPAAPHANGAAPPSVTPAAAPIRSVASPRPQAAATAGQLNSVPPQLRRSSDAAPRPTPPPTADSSSGPSRRCSVDPSTLSAVEWSVDGIRSTLRTLLRNRDLYGDVMQEVAMFVSQKEEARLSARANEIFMQRLRSLLKDDRLFFGAVPLCAQLVALEGLDYTLRHSLSTRQPR